MNDDSSNLLKKKIVQNNNIYQYDANSKTLINGSTTYGSIGYKMFGLNIMLGYRIWDYYAQHKGTNITRGVGNFNYSEIFAGIGF